MQNSNNDFWYLSTRNMSSTLDRIHITSIAFYLIFPLVLILGQIFHIDAMLKFERDIMFAGSFALGVWLIFDFFYPAIPVSRTYIVLHHVVAAAIVGLALVFELYGPLAIGILLQEGYTFVFRKLIYAPGLELMADLTRFTVSGALLAVNAGEVHWIMVLLWIFFIVNNAYFFKSTHRKVFVAEALSSS
ncbi:MAG TPA: hypothetical protein VFO10_22735 [Oligoflexus sp.]|uniref:hypothetical protein n=1 Tax=Oligoflexus sp. TaxID=1971216 RepID=UPI002D809B20|nr:hypothetical protein [Oligoflexus sp.]HET9240097.1 hypothetical protein [Oligoflexus sp.]